MMNIKTIILTVLSFDDLSNVICFDAAIMSDSSGAAIEFDLGDCVPGADNNLTIQNVDLEAGTLDIYMVNYNDLAGFQIWLSGLIITGVSGGLAEDTGFMVEANNSMIMGFSIAGDSIISGEGVLTTVSFIGSGDEICLDAATMSNSMADPIIFELGDCVPGAGMDDVCVDETACNYAAEGDCEYASVVCWDNSLVCAEEECPDEDFQEITNCYL